MEQFLQRLLSLRADERARMEAIRDVARESGLRKISQSPELTEMYRTSQATVRALDQRIKDQEDEIARAGRGPRPNPLVAAIQQGGAGDGSSRAYAASWAGQAVTRMRQAFGGEQRAVISGSIDVPSLIPIGVQAIPHPQRVIDLLSSRVQIESFAYEFFRQTARVNNAQPVPDLTAKPVSTLTVEAITDRARIHAHLSEAVPLRIWQDVYAVTSWLQMEMVAGVLDSIEHDAISGDGSGEHQTGVLHVAGTTAVPFATDLPTTLRSAISALQVLGEQPNGWVMNPSDAAALDLLRWGSAGGLLTEGFASDRATIFGSSSNVLGDVTTRVVSPSCPVGTAILADWNQLKLFVRAGTRIDLDASGVLFQQNAIQMRAEAAVGIGITRPQSFAIVALH